MSECKAIVRRGEDLSAESDADVFLTAEVLCHAMTDDIGGCLFCGGSIYHEEHNGLGMEAVAVTCCEDGLAYYGRATPENAHIADRLSKHIGLHVEAAYMIETLMKRLRDCLPESDLRKLDAAVEAGR